MPQADEPLDSLWPLRSRVSLWSLSATSPRLPFNARFAPALMSTILIVPFFMFALVTTSAAVAVEATTSAEMTPAMRMLFTFPFLGSCDVATLGPLLGICPGRQLMSPICGISAEIDCVTRIQPGQIRRPSVRGGRR